MLKVIYDLFMPHWFKRDVLLIILYLISAFEQNGTTYWKRYVWSYFLGAFCCFMCWPVVSRTQSLCSEFRRLFKCCWFRFNGTNIGKQLYWFYAAKTFFFIMETIRNINCKSFLVAKVLLFVWGWSLGCQKGMRWCIYAGVLRVLSIGSSKWTFASFYKSVEGSIAVGSYGCISGFRSFYINFRGFNNYFSVA